MAIVKLQNAGETVTWTITKAETVAGNFGPQVKFENTDGDILFIPAESAERQLGRIPMAVADCVGETLVIARDPNPKPGAKPYWGIRLAGGADKAGPSKRGMAMGGPIAGLDDLPDEAYGQSVHQDDPYLAPPKAPTPHRVPTGEAPKVAPNTAERARIGREYLDLLGWVKAQPEAKGMGDEAVQAVAATIYIAWGKRGLA